MKKSITISIPEPCHEDWGKMTPTEKGKFCSVCTKEVIDFTQTNDEDIVKKVQKGENLCGRFLGSQLDRPMTLERKSRNSLLPYAASLLLPLSVLSHQEAKAQGGVSVFNKPGISLNIGKHSEKSIVTITGIISDKNGKPIQNAEIFVLETGKSTRSNEVGEYTIQCPSGSTLFVQKSDLRSNDVVIGSKDETIHFSLKKEYREYTAYAGMVVSVPAETIKEPEKYSVLEKPIPTTITIKGTITDEVDLPLPSVDITIEGANKGTQTDFDGNYEIEVQPNQTLVFSYLSYKTKEIVVSNISNDISFAMHPDPSVLNNVVVVAGGVSISYCTPDSSLSSKEKREKRREYAAKQNAYKKIQKERAKEARKLKRERRRKK